MIGTESAATVAHLLAGLRRRQRTLNTLRWGVHGLLIGGAAGCLAVLMMWLVGPADVPQLLLAAALTAAALTLAGAIAGALMPINDLALARALDAAGQGKDRFASALQLMNDHHKDRASLIVEDALLHVRHTPAAAALPLRIPRSARWLVAPVALLAAMLLLLPQPKLQAAAAQVPEISPEQWQQIAEEFDKELAQLPKPLTPEEEELQKELERLAELLKENPDKRDALKEIAKLSERVERDRREISPRELSLKKAAKAMSKSAALKQFAAKMQQGEYQNASEELRSLASKLNDSELALDAEEFEAMAQDLEQLAKELEADQELEQECQGASNAASRMNKKELAEALKRMADQMKNNAGKYQRSDNMSRRKSMLDDLKRRMNQKKCEGCGEGCSECEDGNGFCDKPGDKPGNRAGRGGLKAGWGSMAKWDGGDLSKNDEKRVGEMTDTMETQGDSTSFQVVSPDERARSTKRYEELFAEFVQLAEADLDLDSVPVSQREYLRKYFKSIRPKEPAATDHPADPAAPDPAP